jgi:hypothetical protein
MGTRAGAALILLAIGACEGGGDGDEAADAGGVASDCRERLDERGVVYTVGPEADGVADPVTVATPLDGIAHRAFGAEAPREDFFMDCSLVEALLAAAPILAERDIVEVADYGVYNYRCIGGGTPPDCPNGVSQHAYATAFDIAGYTTSDGTFYSVNDDWVIDGDDEDTCAAATDGDDDAFLHEVICAQKAADVWNIVLTPNYNADHRNHFHADLTPEGDFIERALDSSDR